MQEEKRRGMVESTVTEKLSKVESERKAKVFVCVICGAAPTADTVTDTITHRGKKVQRTRLRVRCMKCESNCIVGDKAQSVVAEWNLSQQRRHGARAKAAKKEQQ